MKTAVVAVELATFVRSHFVAAAIKVSPSARVVARNIFAPVVPSLAASVQMDARMDAITNKHTGVLFLKRRRLLVWRRMRLVLVWYGSM